MNGDGFKTCRDCSISKPLGEFSPNKRSRDGATSYCRSCLRLRHQAYRDARRTTPRVRAVNEPAASRTQKWCPACQQTKPIDDFARNRSARDGRTGYCRPCHNAKTTADKERHGGARNYHLLRRYGITVADYDRMVEAQGGLCAVCRERPPEHVDHDHVTGRVRGVLCSCCNQGLGNFRDDAAIVRAAADYLERTTWQRHQEFTVAYRRTSRHRGVRPSSTSWAERLLTSYLQDAPSPPG